MTSIEQVVYLNAAAKLIAGLVVPYTPLIARTVLYARERYEPYLFDHAMRSWLFAIALARTRGTSHDAEVLAVASLLHDLGLSGPLTGSMRFEVDGANAARSLASGSGMSRRRAQLVWDCVALSSTPSIGLYKEPEVALCTAGIWMDLTGAGRAELAPSQITSIVDAYPRLAMKEQLIDRFCAMVESRPQTTYDNFLRDFGERFVPGYKRPSMVDMLFDAPFKE